MTRSTRYKLGYLAVLVAGLAIVGVVLYLAPDPVPVAFVMVALLLIPGRIQGALWRDFFRGRRLLGAGDPEQAAAHFESFLERLRRRPALKAATWLSWSIHTRSIEAMTWNNLGAAKVAMGKLDDAEAHFNEALRVDPLYPLPYAGLADIALRRNHADAARSNAERAIALGYGNTTVDALLRSLSAAYAHVEGRGVTPRDGAGS